MRIYHGSEFEIKKPEFGKGKIHNDYGQGFYCTESIELAKEWAVDENHNGFANVYDLNLQGLKILNLNDSKFNILHWITILLKNRTFRANNRIAKDSKEYLLNNFSIDTSKYDIIIGYRADDSYFSFAEDFINNTISVKKLSEAMKLGNLGEQIVLISKKAFDSIKFIGSEQADKITYFKLKTRRDKSARTEYLNSNKLPNYSKDELYMIDIMREGIKSNDARLR